jgi:hypothetical protein
MTDDHTPILEVDAPDYRLRAYLLQPGERFPGFGGSRTGLLVRATTSLITREEGLVMGRLDIEHDASDPKVWARIRRTIRTHGLKPEPA